MRASMGRFCVLSAFFLWGTVPAAALDSSALVTSMQNTYYGATGIDTIAGTIARDGTTSVSGTAGVDANATIHIGSQSKMFTSMVLLKLIDDHGLSLDDRLGDVAAKASLSDSAKLTALIASLPVEARSYTLRDFLNMGTALPNFMAGTPAGQNQTLWDLWKAANYGAVAGFVHFVQDMTSQKLVETLRRLAFYDSLTGLPNRSLIEDRLALAIAHARRRRTSFAVLCIDMDQFKQVNDTLGHATGDRLLAAVAQRLQAALRTTDTLGRWGGDEFVAIVEDAQRTDALLTVANKLVATGERPYWIGDRQYRMTLSIGASLYPDHAHDQAGLLAVADAAMYRAKAAGGNTWRVPPP
ncbi:MAG: hypothetical protein DI596_09715 [Azospira oryzae]|nr:MAG: hypothetical protein DI596_09715 [Azospira oryzae]PZP78797.1 MAG: hypothetical protein DI593_09715 [Azospira oryzae]